MLYEGGEDHPTLMKRFADINSFLKCNGKCCGYRVCAWEGGDLKYLCLKCGLSGNFLHHDMCLWCEVPRAELSSLNSYPARTINSIRVNAHLPPLDELGHPVWPFTCPGCDIVFLNEYQQLAEVLSAQSQKEFPSIHKGSCWHRAPCTTTPIDRIVPCVLHMRLRFMCTLWDWCIAPSAMVKKPAVATMIVEMLQKDGVNTNRLRKINNFNDVQTVAKASFDGQGCDKVMAHFDDYLQASRSDHRELG